MLVSSASSSATSSLSLSSSSSSSSNTSPQEPLLIRRRNDHAWNVITESLHDTDHVEALAILYGSSHIPDLTRRLMQMGFVLHPSKTTWRTAWSVTIPNQDSSDKGNVVGMSSSSSLTTPLALGLIVLPLYFGIGGWDWIATLQQVAQDVEHSNVVDAGVEVVLYLLRHALLYLSLAKFVIEWDSRKS